MYKERCGNSKTTTEMDLLEEFTVCEKFHMSARFQYEVIYDDLFSCTETYENGVDVNFLLLNSKDMNCMFVNKFLLKRRCPI